MYQIVYSDGRRSVTTLTYEEAVALLQGEFPDLEYGHAGDLSEGGDRTLAWACEEDSADDDGRSAVASIRETE